MRMLVYPLFVSLLLGSCKKGKDNEPGVRYFQVGLAYDGFKNEWRDTAFLVAASDPKLLSAIEDQLRLPVKDRKILIGKLVSGSGGFNKNASHTFNWHFAIDGFHLTDMSAEILDGRPYSDVELHNDEFMRIGAYSPWNMVIKSETHP